MKKHLSTSLLFSLLLPVLGFSGIASLPPPQEITSHKSVVWGFTCIEATGNVYPAFTALYTYDLARKISGSLGQHGYTTELHNNLTEQRAIQQSLESAEVFFYVGHGAPNALGLTDATCNIHYFTKDDLRKIDTHRLKFVLLSACDTGKDVSQSDSILRAFQEAGAEKAIGLNRTLPLGIIKQWTERFWQYALRDGMEVGDAADRAAFELELLDPQHAVTPDTLAILGTEDVYLGYDRLPELGQGLEQFFPNLWAYVQNESQQLIDQVSEGLKSWLAERWANIRKSIENQIQQELSRLWGLFINELEKFLVQTCLQPLAFALAFAGVLLHRKRRSLL